MYPGSLGSYFAATSMVGVLIFFLLLPLKRDDPPSRSSKPYLKQQNISRERRDIRHNVKDEGRGDYPTA